MVDSAGGVEDFGRKVYCTVAFQLFHCLGLNVSRTRAGCSRISESRETWMSAILHTCRHFRKPFLAGYETVFPCSSVETVLQPATAAGTYPRSVKLQRPQTERHQVRKVV